MRDIEYQRFRFAHSLAVNRILNVALYPLLVPVYVVAFELWYLQKAITFPGCLITLVFLILMFVIPAALARILRKRGSIASFWFNANAEEKRLLLLVDLLCCVVPMPIVGLTHMPFVLKIIPTITLVLMFVSMFVNYFTSVNNHILALSAALAYWVCFSVCLHFNMLPAIQVTMALLGVKGYFMAEHRQLSGHEFVISTFIGALVVILSFVIS